MRTYGSLKLVVAVLASLAVTAAFALCRTGRTGHQYWDEQREACRNCSSCKEPGHIVLRPCQVHQDTVCGPLHALNIDWSWLSHRSRNTSHNHQHHKEHNHHWSSESSWSSSGSSNNQRGTGKRYQKHWHRSNSSKSYHHHYHHHHKKIRPPESAAQLKASDAADDIVARPSYAASRAPEPTSQPFTTPETLVWDWQVVVLALAVLACVLFFCAAAGYGVRQVRHDACRTADVEDLSATLSLMVPGINSELPETCTPAAEACNTNQCLYMEQLLVRKQPDGCGNVYIDRDITGSPRM